MCTVCTHNILHFIKTLVAIQTVNVTIQHAALLTQNNSESFISNMNNPRLYHFTLYLRESLITLSVHLKGVRVRETSNWFNLDKTVSIAHTKQLISNQSEHPITMQHFL